MSRLVELSRFLLTSFSLTQAADQPGHLIGIAGHRGAPGREWPDVRGKTARRRYRPQGVWADRLLTALPGHRSSGAVLDGISRYRLRHKLHRLARPAGPGAG